MRASWFGLAAVLAAVAAVWLLWPAASAPAAFPGVVPPPAAGPVGVDASVPAPQRLAADLPAAAAETPGAVLPATGTLQITVVSELNQPLAGCVLRVVGAEPEMTARTDAQGRAALTLPCEAHMLDVAPPNARFMPAYGRVTVEPGEEALTIVLQHQGDLPFCARLLAGEPAAAAAGVRAVLCLRDERRDELLSDTRGIVQALANQEGSCLEIPAGAASGPCFIVPLPGHATPDAALDVVLPPLASLRLAVVDGADRPLAGLAVRIAPRREDITFPAGAYAPRSPPGVEAATDRVGGGLAEGRCAGARVAVEVQTGRMPLLVEHRLVAGANTLTVRIDHCGLRGRLLDLAGAPLADVEVGVEFWPSGDAPPVMRGGVGGANHVRTGEDGSFRFEQLCSGAWIVGVIADGAAEAAWTPICERVELQAGRDAVVELRAGRGGLVAGTAVLPDGVPAGGVGLDLMLPEPRSDYVTSVRTAADGSFRIGPLPPGAWAIHTDVFEGSYGIPQPVPVRTGDAGVRLQLQRTMAEVRVQVVDAAGHPRRAWVGMRRRDGDGLGVHTGLDGRFLHSGLRAGIWDVRADDLCGGVAALFDVDLQPAAAPTRLRLQLVPGGTLIVRCPQDPDQEVRCRQADRIGYIDDVRPGEVRRIALPPGSWQIELRVGRRVLRKGTAVVVAGREQEVAWQ